ncbi:NUDIX hydrolase [Camelimonas lactis]|uniref:NrtR DNA-binding winged helix domain-containing protein n=1 Tax=Camelimonas lactis TaxID=659006 RepID=A0A4R2GPY9_9HYPH|nr:hypothetical protein [Camelimonas lactis]TCO11746.1 hypothetical protein EV666_11120 [Camelimonas lactis]
MTHRKAQRTSAQAPDAPAAPLPAAPLPAAAPPAPDSARPGDLAERNVLVDLVAVVVAVSHDEPRVLTLDNGASLPAGPFGSDARSLQTGLRDWVERQTHHPLGYVEQLYTFADRDRTGADGQRVMSISYLALTREQAERRAQAEGTWLGWYACFPWEDWRDGQPAVVREILAPALMQWAAAAPSTVMRAQRRRRVATAFGLDGATWHDEMVLQRYELLHEARLTPESLRHVPEAERPAVVAPGHAMTGDHRRILATGVARLRGKIRYRPVVFELMPETFTLLDLQKAVEALAGRRTHKQNFRRLVEQQELVEETSEMSTTRVGRPARLFRFREEVLLERAIAGTKPAG